jgi:hypothetical protein
MLQFVYFLPTFHNMIGLLHFRLCDDLWLSARNGSRMLLSAHFLTLQQFIIEERQPVLYTALLTSEICACTKINYSENNATLYVLIEEGRSRRIARCLSNVQGAAARGIQLCCVSLLLFNPNALCPEVTCCTKQNALRTQELLLVELTFTHERSH